MGGPSRVSLVQRALIFMLCKVTRRAVGTAHRASKEGSLDGDGLASVTELAWPLLVYLAIFCIAVGPFKALGTLLCL